MPNCVNISVRIMLHSHLCPQGSRVWVSNSNQECIPTKCKEDSTTWLVVWKKVVVTLSSSLCAWCGKWRSKSADPKPQSKLGTFDDISHDPWARQSSCKCLCLCSRPSRSKPCIRGPHLHYNWPYPEKWRCSPLQRPYDKRGCNDNIWRAERGWKS
jgi:hypothetical protein